VRVALVCPYDLGKPGGVQDQVTMLAHWLANHGHDPVVVGPGSEGPETSVLVGGTVTIPANRSAAPISVDPRVVNRVKKAVDGADVVHVHEPFMPAVSLAATLTASAPTVGTFHADAPSWARHLLASGRAITRSMAHRLDVVTAVSDIARSSVGVVPSVRIIPNGLDITRFAPSEKEPASVVFVGRDDKRKGLSVLLRAWPYVREHHPSARLRVVGASRDTEIAGVEFLGRVPEETKISVLATSGIAVAPNTGGESFGIVIVEAMASGCAVIASALPAFISVLGGTGELVEVGDADGLAGRIVTMLDDEERRSSKARAAMDRARLYDVDTVARSYLDAYTDAIAVHR
jgi:phosphatidyl-myo-inositol alpha-mannosyltransferase